MPDQEDFLSGGPEYFAETPTEKPAAPKPEVEEKIPSPPPVVAPARPVAPITPEVFFSSLTDEISVKDISFPDAPEPGKTQPISGRVSSSHFANDLGSGSFEGKLVYVNPERADDAVVTPGVTNVSLYLDPDGILRYIGAAADHFITKYGYVGKSIQELVEEIPTAAFVGIFAKIFEALKAKSGTTIHWVHAHDEKGGHAYVVQMPSTYKAEGFGMCGRIIAAKFNQSRHEINEASNSILHGGGTRQKKSPTNTIPRAQMLQFVYKLPEERFKVLHERGVPLMVTTLKLEDLPENLREYVQKTPKDETSGFSYQYNPSSNEVRLENKGLTDRRLITDLYRTYKGHPEPSKGLESQVAKYVAHLSDKVRDKVMRILHLKPSIEKVADYGDPWPGPSLEQIGHLVGTPQAQWASELAGKLAANFNYISYPIMVGEPKGGVLEKWALLPLSDEQRIRAEKYRPQAIEMLKALVSDIYESDAMGEGEATGFLMEPEQMAEEAGMMAEDALLDVTSELPSTVSEEDFLAALCERMHAKVRDLYQHQHTALPSEQSSPEDIYYGRPVSIENLEQVPIEKCSHCGPCTPEKAEAIKQLKQLSNVDKADISFLEKHEGDRDLSAFIEKLDSILQPLSAEDPKVIGLRQIAVVLHDIQGRLDDGEFKVVKKVAELQGAVQIRQDDPEIPKQLRGRMGKILEHRVDWQFCPEHGAEPVSIYLVEVDSPYPYPRTFTVWMSEQELVGAGSVN